MISIHLPKIWTSLRAMVLTVMLIVTPYSSLLSRAGTDDRPAATSFDHSVYLPLAVRNFVPSSTEDPVSAPDALIVRWAESVVGGERTILLQWNPQDEGTGAAASASSTGYTISRRESGGSTWQVVGQARPAASSSAMVTQLGADLTLQLRWDLRDACTADPLTELELYTKLFEDPLTARLLAMQYHEVALVLGFAYLDRFVPLNKALDYQVEGAGGSPREYVPAYVPAQPGDLPVPTNLREAWDGPATLGLIPSSRPADADERYEWTETQHYRPWDGTIYLMWDLPEEPEDLPDPGEVDTEGALNLKGYLVYRAAPGSQDWQVVNQQKDDCQVSGPAEQDVCTLMVGATGFAGDSIGPDYMFREDLREVYTAPEDIYTAWRYKVCPVDLLGNVGACSAEVTITARELLPPAPVQSIQATPTETEPRRVVLNWIYSDDSELSPPLRFYVTRSLTFTAALESWEPVYPAGSSNPYIETATATPGRMTISDTPPLDQPHWYRVQVRDAAGNWSAPSVPAMGALYTRTPPRLPQPDYDARACENNPMPFRLTRLGAEVVQIVVYRAFTSRGPWELAWRVPVSEGAAIIADDYVPPHAMDVYYQFEAVDAHGNVSAAVDYCAQLTSSLPPPPPTVDTRVACKDNACDLVVEIDDPDTAYPSSEDPIVEIGMPGEDGTVVITTTLIDGTAAVPINEGAWYTVTVTYAVGGPGATHSVRRVNNFLDTNRHLADLGPLHSVAWDTDTVSGKHFVRVVMAPLDGPPPVAAFRRIPGGNWMQVTAIETPGPYALEDHSDPSPTQEYEYVVLAFSPNTYEMLGVWERITLSPLREERVDLDDTKLDPTPEISGSCGYDRRTAAQMDMHSSIFLHNGWEITDVHYYYSRGGPECPSNISPFDPNHAYGDGTLTNGSLTWPVSLYDVAVNPTTGAHQDGRIVADLDHEVTGSNILPATFQRMEFLPGSVVADVLVTLPPTIKLHHAPSGARSHHVRGQVEDVATDFRFAPRTLSDRFYWVEENLPWQLHGEADLRYNGVKFDGSLVTVDRLGYTPVWGSWGAFALPDTNLGYLRVSYQGPTGGAIITPGGLNGRFTTEEPIHYSTGQPAGFVITALGGASVEIVDSRITSGLLKDASAELTYWHQTTYADYLVAERSCDARPQNGYSLCSSQTGPGDIWSHINMTPNRGDLPIQRDGQVIADVTLDRHATWVNFEARMTEGTLYIAGAAFADEPTSWAPMPAENTWRQQNLDLGDLDPGLNINAEFEESNYTCYEPSLFEETDMDLYVRRGGVSEFLGIYEGDDPGERVNTYGYQERVHVFEGIFVDNRIVQPPDLNFQAQLYLPYPSDAVFDLIIREVNAATNCAASGDIRSPAPTLHQYWNFVETPREEKGFLWNDGLEKYDGALGSQTAVFGLVGTAEINGLHERSTADPDLPVTMEAYTEWLPSGDIGDVTAYSLTSQGQQYQVSGLPFGFTKVELSRFYSDPTDLTSLPSTCGIDMADNFAELPEAMLDRGDLTPESLWACAQRMPVGCGFVLLDGNASIPYFGEPYPTATAATLGQLGGIPSPPLTVDELMGHFPIANNELLTMTQNLLANATSAYLQWIVFNEVVEEHIPVDLPVKFLGSTEGAVIAALAHDASLLPGMEIFQGDIGAVVTLTWEDGGGFVDKLGIYVGYPASQAALRALAMNRQHPSGLIQPFDRWEDVEDDVRTWAFEKFGYTEGDGEDDDPVDLARVLWEDTWCTSWKGDECTNRVDFIQAYEIVEPLVKDVSAGADAYGMSGLTSGEVLAGRDVYLGNGAAEILLVQAGNSFVVERLQGGASIRYGEDLVSADWITVQLTGDSQLAFFGEAVIQLIDQDPSEGYLFGLATFRSKDDWRVEGTLHVSALRLSNLFGEDVSLVYGIGQVSGHEISYVGGKGDFIIWESKVGATVLFGSLVKDSPILREVGYGNVLDQLGDSGPYEGWYVYATGRIKLIDGGCLLSAPSAQMEVRLWAFDDGAGGETYGGEITGTMYPVVLCILSGRANLSLEYDRADRGFALYGLTCDADRCDVYSGSFWVALGLGWCEPKTWDSWHDKGSNWWDDTWCYTFGVHVGLAYFDPPGGGAGWDAYPVPAAE